MPKRQPLSFESALVELRSIAERLDTETVGVEEGLRQFERGLKLVEYLKIRLEETENKVREIKYRFRSVVPEPDDET